MTDDELRRGWCPKCGMPVTVIAHFLGPIMSHEPGDKTCLTAQLAAANAQLAERDARIEEYYRGLKARDEISANQAQTISERDAEIERLRVAFEAALAATITRRTECE